ncbi:erythromycin esterase family protein [Streptomyces sp. NPDC003077]|uniref:erythromycin esterase family protein n=1 Tax=Streptomyces sp. NPDC003077 TaxID=3154443 RepID=UPI00339DB859
MNGTLNTWLRQHAHPLATAPEADTTDLRPLDTTVRNAAVVTLGATTRVSHELSALAFRMVRHLVERHGFRSLAWEGDDPVRLGLAAYVRTGDGDPRAFLSAARSFWRTEEALAIVRWMRAYNLRHPDDPVRFAEPFGPVPTLADGLPAIERRLAEDTVRWHEHTGDRIVYWGGIAHTAVRDPRTLTPAGSPITHHNAGSRLRARFGAGLVSVGMTFHHGSAALPVPAPPAGSAEVVLDGAEPDAYALTWAPGTGAEALPTAVRDWLTSPARLRFLGPGDDRRQDAAHHLTGASLAAQFDALIHVRTITPVAPVAPFA